MESPATAKGDGDTEPLTRARRQMARRVAESRATVPSFTAMVEVDVEAVGGPVGAAVVRACGLALRDHPRANATYRGDAVELHGQVNVGVVIATDDAPVVATVFAADTKDVATIAGEVEALTAAALDGSIAPPQLSGATFTVLELSAAGAQAIEPVVLPPQVATLSVAAVRARAVVWDGAVVARRVAVLTLAVDARAVAADEAAALLGRVRELVESG